MLARAARYGGVQPSEWDELEVPVQLFLHDQFMRLHEEDTLALATRLAQVLTGGTG